MPRRDDLSPATALGDIETAMGGLVSVILPTFNRAYCVGRAIDSALQQTHHDLEVVVVDDGSTDDTRELIKREYGSCQSVRYIYQENAGVAAARNTALRAARGEFIAFLDSDDIWKPWKIELQIACMEKLPHIGMVWSDMEAVGPDGTVTSRRYLRKMYAAYGRFPIEKLFTERHDLPTISTPLDPELTRGALYAGDIFSPMVTGNLVHTSTVLLRRNRADRVHGFDEELHHSGEDYDFHLRTCREGPVGFIDLATISYQTGMPDQLVRQSYWVAQNFIKTLSATLERDRERITLPPRMINEVLADANAWVAETLISRGEPREASGYLRRSLYHKPWQLRAFVQLILCQLPPGLSEVGRRVYRSVRRRGTS
jgi:GT2 family glycosyltransferase